MFRRLPLCGQCLRLQCGAVRIGLVICWSLGQFVCVDGILHSTRPKRAGARVRSYRAIRWATLASRLRRLVDVIVRHEFWRLRKEVKDVDSPDVGR